MKILMLTSDVSLQCGIARHVLEISSSLQQEQGIEVAVCTVYPEGELNDVLRERGVRSFSLNVGSGHDFRGLARFREIMRAYKPDVVHVHMLALVERIALNFLFGKIPVVMTCHGITDFESGVRSRNLRDRVDSLIHEMLPFHVAQRIYISEGVRAFRGDSSGIVIYNPMDFKKAMLMRNAVNLREELGLACDSILVGTACRICPPKQPVAFTDVFCRILSQNHAVHAVVCGTGDPQLMAQLNAQVQEAGVADRFHWLGYRSDAIDIVSQLNCFVMTSATEGMPTSLLEAMSVRTPVAFLRGKGGLVDLDLLNSQRGPFAVVADTVPDLATAVLNLINDSNQARTFASRAYAVGCETFDISVVKEKLLSVYRGEVAVA